MKTETKAELRERIALLEMMLAEATKISDAAERADWEKKIPIASIKAFHTLAKTFPNTFYDLTFIHVDKGGYWYTFSLINDDRKQTYCVRHSDLEEARQEERKVKNDFLITYGEVFEKIVKIKFAKPDDDYMEGWNDALDALRENI